ncbi:MAG: hypothetical protein GXP54_09575 [Deltaproteobacteria bacterium]|nr:hypothetical protein [Deltaproteobacteria bacterium]
MMESPDAIIVGSGFGGFRPQTHPMERSGAVCYNCRLSGHQPVDAQGWAHFWHD